MEMINIENLTKKFGDLTAVDSISFTVEKGEIFGFLGPNGAGKTTTINIICTLMKPTSGKVILDGLDVTHEQHKVRQSIGLVFQDPSLDEQLTAQENLMFHALTYNIPKKERKKSIDSVLKLVELEDRRKDVVKKYSGGMKRRLEIARGLLHQPKVLFLDEPTLGLDPQTRNHIWEHIHKMKKEREMTIFLTTHYMDEAENCDRIAIIDYGKIISLATPDELKKQFKGDMIAVRSEDNNELAAEIEKTYKVSTTRDNDEIHFEIDNGEEFIPKFISKFGSKVRAINLHRPTLDDVFLKLTGRAIRAEGPAASTWMKMGATRK